MAEVDKYVARVDAATMFLRPLVGHSAFGVVLGSGLGENATNHEEVTAVLNDPHVKTAIADRFEAFFRLAGK